MRSCPVSAAWSTAAEERLAYDPRRYRELREWVLSAYDRLAPEMNATPPKPTGPRMNEGIRAPRILVITEDGEKQGPMSADEGRDLAARAGLDLVEVSPNDDVPVCKLMDWGKHKYQQQKKKAEAKKKQKVVEIKEIKMRPNIDTHDYELKTKAMRRFFEEGDKVKVTLRFRGREMAHQRLGAELLQRVADDVTEAEAGKIENMPKMEGRQMIMMIGPVRK